MHVYRADRADKVVDWFHHLAPVTDAIHLSTAAPGPYLQHIASFRVLHSRLVSFPLPWA